MTTRSSLAKTKSFTKTPPSQLVICLSGGQTIKPLEEFTNNGDQEEKSTGVDHQNSEVTQTHFYGVKKMLDQQVLNKVNSEIVGSLLLPLLLQSTQIELKKCSPTLLIQTQVFSK